MEKYVCTVCGYVYDPAENDGVPFKKLPDDVSVSDGIRMALQNIVK